MFNSLFQSLTKLEELLTMISNDIKDGIGEGELTTNEKTIVKAINEINDNISNKIGDLTGLSNSNVADELKSHDAQLGSIANYGNILSNIKTMKQRYEAEYVNVKDFGAIGDGETDDTISIQNAIDYAQNTGINKVLFSSNGNYIFTTLTIPYGVEIKMNTWKVVYYTADKATVSSIKCKLTKKSASSVDGLIVNEGRLTDVTVNGNNNTGNLVVINGGQVDGLFVYDGASSGSNGVVCTGSSILMERFFITNCDNALILKGNCHDSQFSMFNIWNNMGHGLVFDGAGTTSRFSNGKIEWNYKNNILVNSYVRQVFFTSCIIDSANWFNIQFSAIADNWMFSSCMIIGGKRDLAPASAVANTCMIYITSSVIQLVFNCCYFQKLNSGQGAVDKITSIIDADIDGKGNYVLNSCDCGDFNYVDIILKCERKVILGTLTLDGTYFGNNAMGDILALPSANSVSTNKNRYINQSLSYDSEIKKVVVKLWENYYDTDGNQLYTAGKERIRSININIGVINANSNKSVTFAIDNLTSQHFVSAYPEFSIADGIFYTLSPVSGWNVKLNIINTTSSNIDLGNNVWRIIITL